MAFYTGAYWYFQTAAKRVWADNTMTALNDSSFCCCFLGCSRPCCNAVSNLFFYSSALHHVTLESLCNSCCLARKSINFNECFCTKGLLALSENNESKDNAEYEVGNLQDKQKGEKCLGKERVKDVVLSCTVSYKRIIQVPWINTRVPVFSLLIYCTFYAILPLVHEEWVDM